MVILVPQTFIVKVYLKRFKTNLKFLLPSLNHPQNTSLFIRKPKVSVAHVHTWAHGRVNEYRSEALAPSAPPYHNIWQITAPRLHVMSRSLFQII